MDATKSDMSSGRRCPFNFIFLKVSPGNVHSRDILGTRNNDVQVCKLKQGNSPFGASQQSLQVSLRKPSLCVAVASSGNMVTTRSRKRAQLREMAEHFPEELCIEVLSHVGGKDISRAVCATQVFANVRENVWRSACERRWPAWSQIAASAVSGSASTSCWSRGERRWTQKLSAGYHQAADTRKSQACYGPHRVACGCKLPLKVLSWDLIHSQTQVVYLAPLLCSCLATGNWSRLYCSKLSVIWIGT